MEELKKLIWVYLCETFPDAHRKVTKFGSVLVGDNNNVARHTEIETIVNLFSCSYEFASQVFSEFILTRPIYYPLQNATNMEVLVSTLPIINTSTNLKTPTIW